MSSAEDTGPLIASPSANSTTSPGEFPVPAESEGAPASASASSVEAPDEPEEGTLPETKTKPLPKVNAVAHEVNVKVTGARPIPGAIERELFTESTTTVLVFEKGGVIRLVAAVAPGQLLFLANEDTKREVVAQVTRKRVHRPTDCYVELEFTEPAHKFWGMEFSAATALLPKDAKQAEAAALVASAETSADDPEHAAPAPTAEEVLALRKEVEALRGKLNSLHPQLPVGEPAPATVQTTRELMAQPWEPAPTTLATSAPPREVPSATPESPLAPPSLSTSLPPDHATRTLELPATEKLTPPPPPKPTFDFSQSLPKRKKRSFRAKGNFTPGFRTGMLRLALLSTALVITIIGAAWYKNWLPWTWKPAPKGIAVAAWSGATTTPAPSPGGPSAAATGEAHGGSGKPANNTSAEPSTEVSSGITVHENLPEPAAKEKPAESSTAAEPVGRPASHRSKPAAAITKRVPADVAAAAVVPASANDAAFVPPKLIRSAKAVASLEDLRDFETGSVIIEAVVDTAGDVISMNVLSGPPSLRQPAMDALRSYRYEPALRNGKPVPARVSVKIQFHFE